MKRKRPTLREWDAVNAGYAEVKRLYRLAVAERTEFEKIVEAYKERAKLTDAKMMSLKEECDKQAKLLEDWLNWSQRVKEQVAVIVQFVESLRSRKPWYRRWLGLS